MYFVCVLKKNFKKAQNTESQIPPSSLVANKHLKLSATPGTNVRLTTLQ